MIPSDWIDILDVSAAQGKAIDWPRVAAAQVAPNVSRNFRGAYIKVSEATFIDGTAAKNLAGARAANLLVGAYHYLHPHEPIVPQIETAWRAIGDTMPSFPLAIDLEAADAVMTPGQLVDALRDASDAVQARFGRPPVFYSYPNFVSTRMQPALAADAYGLSALPLWWASYGSGRPWYPQASDVPHAPIPFKAITMLQYSGNTKKTPGTWNGAVDGIAGDVDRSVYLLGEDAFRYDFCGEPRPEQNGP